MTPRVRKFLVWLAALTAMSATFAMYLQPEMLRTLADQIWACF